MKINKKVYNMRILKKTVVFITLLLFITTFMTSEMNTNATEDIEWSITLDLTETNDNYDYVIFGEAPDANDGPPHDEYDMPKPPAPIPPYLRAWLYDNLSAPYNLMFKDYRKSPDDYKIWNLFVEWVIFENLSTTITIFWDKKNISSIEYDSIKLYKNGESNPISNLLIDSSYSYLCQPNELQQFQIICQNENLNDKTDIIQISSFFLIIALIIIVIIIMLIVYWKKKR